MQTPSLAVLAYLQCKFLYGCGHASKLVRLYVCSDLCHAAAAAAAVAAVAGGWWLVAGV
jgi:hypothetical protein